MYLKTDPHALPMKNQTSSGVIFSEGNSSEGTHRIFQRIQLQIPAQYTQDPIISRLSRYEVEVNIHSALLANNAQESGWFDLELRGRPERVQQALDYLSGLHIEIWTGNAAAGDESWDYR